MSLIDLSKAALDEKRRDAEAMEARFSASERSEVRRRLDEMAAGTGLHVHGEDDGRGVVVDGLRFSLGNDVAGIQRSQTGLYMSVVCSCSKRVRQGAGPVRDLSDIARILEEFRGLIPTCGTKGCRWLHEL